MKNFLLEFGLEASSLVAGLMGGIISLTYEKNLTFFRACFLILTGALTAGYLTPLLCEYLNLGNNLQNALSFIIGLTSMRILGFIIKVVEKRGKLISGSNSINQKNKV